MGVAVFIRRSTRNKPRRAVSATNNKDQAGLTIPRSYGPPPRSYTSTRPIPVPLFDPARIAVYAPGGRVAARADSFVFEGASPAAVICAAWAESSCQSLFDRRRVP